MHQAANTTFAPERDARTLEKYSSAVTLSDMEIFIFPELLYSLMLANIMSPRIWKWLDDPWFDGIERLTPYRRVLRLKQFIIDRYEFNLDLDTWGLTNKARELARFRSFVDEDILRRSNALFGYEGDKYYFDIDIRRHFGLDKYTSDIIPYWKTETVEAMDAFRFREGYGSGAGECVSLSTLYAAALFVVCKIPIEDIFLLATPLHSQNFVCVRDGILTNNRRVVTKNMWFNGTELTFKAQRALRNEQITVVAHHTGHVHVVDPEATMPAAVYERFKDKLHAFLSTPVNAEIVANFLRQESRLQSCFQVAHEHHGKMRYIPAERVYAYEHTSSFRVSDATREKLLAEIDEDEYYPEPIADRISLNLFDDFFKTTKIDLSKPEDREKLQARFTCNQARAGEVLTQLMAFCHLQPRFPDSDQTKTHVESPPILLTTDMDRDAVIAYLDGLRASHPVADLAFYAYRDLSRTSWAPFLKAALERNPVCIDGAKDLEPEAVIEKLRGLPDESIYDGPRLAQPDEVWNYGRGDGAEKAICLAGIWKARHPQAAITLRADRTTVTLTLDGRALEWTSSKGLIAEKEL